MAIANKKLAKGPPNTIKARCYNGFMTNNFS